MIRAGRDEYLCKNPPILIYFSFNVDIPRVLLVTETFPPDSVLAGLTPPFTLVNVAAEIKIIHHATTHHFSVNYDHGEKNITYILESRFRDPPTISWINFCKFRFYMPKVKIESRNKPSNCLDVCYYFIHLSIVPFRRSKT